MKEFTCVYMRGKTCGIGVTCCFFCEHLINCIRAWRKGKHDVYKVEGLRWCYTVLKYINEYGYPKEKVKFT